MTTAKAQVARIRKLILIAILPIVGCTASPDDRIYRIDGAITDFCIPPAVDVTPARSSQAGIVRGGAAMNGCWKAVQGTCVGPESLISLSVTDKTSFLGRRFEDFPNDAHVGTVANRKRRDAKPLGENLIAIQDDVDANKWFLWRATDAQGEKMAANDELEATCFEKVETGGYLCDRKVAATDYLLEYSFISRNDLPTRFRAMDETISGEVEKLRCKK